MKHSTTKRLRRRGGSGEEHLVCRALVANINTDVVGIVPLDDTNHDIEIFVSDSAAVSYAGIRLIGYFV